MAGPTKASPLEGARGGPLRQAASSMPSRTAIYFAREPGRTPVDHFSSQASGACPGTLGFMVGHAFSLSRRAELALVRLPRRPTTFSGLAGFGHEAGEAPPAAPTGLVRGGLKPAADAMNGQTLEGELAPEQKARDVGRQAFGQEAEETSLPATTGRSDAGWNVAQAGEGGYRAGQGHVPGPSSARLTS